MVVYWLLMALRYRSVSLPSAANPAIELGGGDVTAATLDDVTADFPPTWISGGNADPLTDAQSKPFAARLTTLGVPVTSVFYDEGHVPALPHEYQFHLDRADAQTALDSTLAFLDSVTKG